jgi:hypothetical protein
MLGGSNMGLTIHFNKEAPEKIEQWLSTEARYIIGAFGKPYDLHKVYGDRASEVIAECRRLGEKIVSGITMILDADLSKLRYIKVSLQNGDTFHIDNKYSPVGNAETISRIEELVLEDGPEVFPVSNL